jgi:hypothetical protein
MARTQTIRNLEPSKPIFVFGSNLAGRHGLGAARTARLHYGAIYGQGEGLQGYSYAIPTKDANLAVLPLHDIDKAVGRFVRMANYNSKYTFKVTPIGTGLAGYTHDDIAPMFALAEVNLILPYKWKTIIPELEGRKFWYC